MFLPCTVMAVLPLLFLVAASLATTTASGLPRIRVDESGRFRDNAGRQRLFHGFNRVRKGFPWYDAALLNKTKLGLYQKWGLNAARIGCMWSGVAPQRDQYNETYINITKETVQLLEDHGIYALLDMHQDVISSRYGSYDGVPLWVINSFPNDSLPYPFPIPKELITQNWGLGYLTMAVARAFQHLYDNTSGGLDRWGDFWEKVAKTFKDQTSVIGYELINEPFAGDFYKNLKILLPGMAGRLNLLPAYDSLVGRIRSVDNDTLVFYEPVTWGVFDGADSKYGSGFSRVPGGPSQRTKSVLSYHYYCWILPNNTATMAFTTVQKVLCDDILMPSVFPAVEQDIARTGGGAFLTEFGLCEPDGNPTSINTVECELVMSRADDHFQSWTYWDTAFFREDGSVNQNVVKAFARAYPRAVAGNLTALTFDVQSGILIFGFQIDTAIAAPTEVFLPMDVHYPHGFEVSITPQLRYAFHSTNSLLLITATSATVVPPVRTGDLVLVKVTPKAKSSLPSL